MSWLKISDTTGNKKTTKNTRLSSPGLGEKRKGRPESKEKPAPLLSRVFFFPPWVYTEKKDKEGGKMAKKA